MIDDIYLNGMISYSDDLYYLKEFNNYNDKIYNYKFKYELKNENLEILKEKYKFEEIASGKDDFIKKMKLLLWVSNNLKAGSPKEFCDINSINILELTKKNNLQSNCLMYAVTLNEIFLSMGYKSRVVICLPLDLRFNECHCMTLVYSNHYNKWIVMDPALGGIYFDKYHVPLNVLELKQNLINGHEISILFRSMSKNSLLHYLYKNMVKFTCLHISGFNRFSMNNKEYIYLVPNNLLLTDKMDYNNNHHIFTSNSNQYWE